MTRYVALLRGVNVGGRNRLLMADWKALLAARGYACIATYVQSGNAVFDADEAPDELQAQITEDFEDRFGFAPGCCILSAADLDAALAANPFPEVMETPKALHLVFLHGEAVLDEEAAEALCAAGEQFHMGQGVFYLFTPNGYGRSKIAERLDRVLKADLMTARNLSSCLKLQEMAHA
ncbi:DUF1697 domain-containing protein [Nioella aestuarii]|uniref:DUF1697 domain-containing protein n=1 Tax=Nioella aestuarii TaxID=1662864 RepID=UPI003D7FE0D7